MSWQDILKADTIESVYNELKTRKFVLPLQGLKITSSSIMPDGSKNPDFRDKYNTLRGGRSDHVYAHEGYEDAVTEYEEHIRAKRIGNIPKEVENAAIEQYKNTPTGLKGVENTIGSYTIFTRRLRNYEDDDVHVSFEIDIKGGDSYTLLHHGLTVRINEEYVRPSKENVNFDAQSMRRVGQDVGDYKPSQFADKMELL
tara:strand:+ start:2295 stop:2891 length:597 start_codon:yes stop_codon:yes gene_type:complete